MSGEATVRRIRANIRTQHPVPVSMHINITGRCPCRCWHCEKAASRGAPDLPLPFLLDCLDQAEQWGCTVVYSGGEPLVHRQWRELLEAGRARQLTQKLVTSGYGLAAFSSLDRKLLCESLEELMISIDSADAATHDELRGQSGLFSGVMDFLDGPSRPKTTWLIHVPKPDLQSVQSMLELARAKSTGLIVQPYIFISNFPHLETLDTKTEVQSQLPELAAKAEETAQKLAKMASQMGVLSNLEEIALYIKAYYERSSGGPWFGRDVLPRFSCSVPWQQVTIDENGCVMPCVFLGGQKISPESTLAEHWQKQALIYRADQLDGRTWPECRSCTCHFNTNFRNSMLMHPWENRVGWGVALRKKLMKYIPAVLS